MSKFLERIHNYTKSLEMLDKHLRKIMSMLEKRKER